MAETIGEIVAWLRDPKIKNPMRKTWRDVLASRIEAAWKREACQTKEAIASMHTCLVNILVEMQDMSGIEAGRKVKFSPDAIVYEIRSALAVAEGGVK